MKKKSANGINQMLANAMTRRDFIHGIGASAVGATLSPTLFADEELFAPEREPGYYPPILQGLRGSHPGSFESAHHYSWQGGKPQTKPRALNQQYDLVVVGAGISGLATAYYYRKAKPMARILILDNHDDFGGHAKRNEYRIDGEMRLAPGGSVFMVDPMFSQTARDLVSELGIDMQAMIATQEPGDWRTQKYGLKNSIYFDAENYGRAVTLTGDLNPPTQKDENGNFVFIEMLEQMPFSAQAKEELRRLYTEPSDCLPDLSNKQKKDRLKKISYYDFLIKNVKLSHEVANFFINYPSGGAGLLADSVSAWQCFTHFGCPGLRQLGEFGVAVETRLSHKRPKGFSLGPYFSDGNASIARLLVSHLIPAATATTDMHGIIDADIDYAKLDDSQHPVRLRLNSTVVNVNEDGKRNPVAITYMRGGKALQVRARQCVMACYNMMIPHLCPQLPDDQKAALSLNVKAPMISSSVVIRDSAPLLKLNSAYFHSPSSTYQETIGIGRKMGGYNDDLTAGKPTSLYMIGAYAKPYTGLSPHEQFRAARYRLLATPYVTLALEVKNHLNELFSATEFNAERDILGLTINRWPHGYAYSYNSLFDPDYAPGSAPHEIGRQRFGNIAIANSDAGAMALVNTAIDQAHRAVKELTS